jgi:hypothetical protein
VIIPAGTVTIAAGIAKSGAPQGVIDDSPGRETGLFDV